MKIVTVGCGACGAEWQDPDRYGIRAFCETCGSRSVEKLLFGAGVKPGDLARLARADRITGAARLLGYAGAVAARESGDWERWESEGDDPNELEAQYWLATYRAKLLGTLRKETLVLTEEEEQAASAAFTEGWQLFRP